MGWATFWATFSQSHLVTPVDAESVTVFYSMLSISSSSIYIHGCFLAKFKREKNWPNLFFLFPFLFFPLVYRFSVRKQLFPHLNNILPHGKNFCCALNNLSES
jgi:hypothetical protein